MILIFGFFVQKKWVPTYGFRRAQAEREKDWVLEVPDNADPMEDQFAKKQNLKSEKVAKNEIKRMRNIVKAKKMPVPRSGYLGPEAAASSDVSVFLLHSPDFVLNISFCISVLNRGLGSQSINGIRW